MARVYNRPTKEELKEYIMGIGNSETTEDVGGIRNYYRNKIKEMEIEKASIGDDEHEESPGTNNIGKGIYQQIQERGISKPLTKKELEEGLKKMFEMEKEMRVKKEKQRKANEKHLIERAKELGKPIPWLLAYYATSGYTHWVSQEQLSEYKEWLRPTQKEIEQEYINFKLKENE